MIECIERKRAIKEILDIYEYEYPTATGDFDIFATILVPKILNNIPTANVQPVKHGYWIYEDLGYRTGRYKCSNCGAIQGEAQIKEFGHNKFCSDCGARMDNIE